MELKNTTMLYLTILFLLCGLIGLSYGKTNITVSALNPTTTVNPKVNKTRCYPFVGCFGNAPPFTNSQLDLPGSPEQVGTQMFLYTRLNANRSQGDELVYKDMNTITRSHYDSKRPTKFIIHGFTNTIESKWLYEMKDELLKQADLNVVIVSWGPGAAFPNYDQAVANTRMVGIQIRLVIDLMIHAGCKLSDVHVIGHSLGAHTAGYAGYLLHGRIGRITGLDAAEPDFEKHPIETRLDKTDAVFVDAIHTNGASLLTGGAGLMEVSGHVDFYVNGGETQPGCPNQFSGTLSNIFHFHFGSVGDTVACSHNRAVDYFTESINSPCPFTSYKCKDYDTFQAGKCLDCGRFGERCTQMGYFADQSDLRGKVYLNTRSSPPFCGFNYGINFTASGVNTEGKIDVKLIGDFGETDWFSLSSDYEKIQPNKKYTRVFASKVEVGQVNSAQVKYLAKPGFIWGYYGKEVWEAESMEVFSGEIGQRWFFCLRRQQIKNKEVLTLQRTNDERSCQ